MSHTPAAFPQACSPSEQLLQRYLDVRRMTDMLCAPLSADDQMVQSMPDASPTKWHQAHTTWFFETFLLAPLLPQYRPLDPHYRFLFNSYYKQVETPDGSPHPLRAIRGTFSRPTLEQVRQYRQHVDRAMARLLESDALANAEPLLELGIHHEQQHQELIVTDIKHAFWTNPLRPAYMEPGPSARASDASSRPCSIDWREFQGGLQYIGHEGPGFAFDNEGPRHRVYLQPFRIASRAVTNAEYLAFINDGGYRRPELWLSDGWDAIQANRWHAPLYWEQRDGRWFIFTLRGERELAPGEPVCHVSYYEADAYARWAGARLPSESEWEACAAGLSLEGSFLENRAFHPVCTLGKNTLLQMLGDVWEWTSSPYTAYPGYRPPTGALGEYNSKFMCSQMVLRGGSCATPRSHIRATYRNFFAPHTRWQFSGIRLANDCN